MSRFQNRKQGTVVVDFSRGSIKMALAESACEAVRFHGITRIPLQRRAPVESGDMGSEFDAETIVGCIRRNVQRRGWQGLPAACLLSGSATSTQSFLLPPLNPADLRRAISLKMSETLHFDIEDAYFDHRRLLEPSLDDQSPALTLVAAARIDVIRQGVNALRRAGLRPIAVGAAAESLANLSQCTSLVSSEEASIHVDIGCDSTILNLFEGNQLRFSREIDLGGSTFTAALMRPILTEKRQLQLTSEQAEKLLSIQGYPMGEDSAHRPHGIRDSDIVPLLEPVAQRLSVEIERSIDYLCALLNRERIDRVVLSGSTGKMRNLDRFLQDGLGMPVVCNDPVARAMAHWRLAVSDDTPPDLADFSAILGYSLGNRQPINLLPQEEKLVHSVERLTRVRKKLVLPMAAVGLCIAFMGVPKTRDYRSSGAIVQLRSEQMDARLRARTLEESSVQRTRDAIENLRSVRGLVPNWAGVLQELSALLPEEAQLISLDAENSEGLVSLALTARIHADSSSFHPLSTQLAITLAQSPFLKDVRVIEATIASGEPHGIFEARMEVIAGGAVKR